MSDKPVLYGYSPSTFVWTVRMVLADKDVDYDQVPVNVLGGETRLPEHLARHPFGKVPVLDIDGMRLREAEPICRYVDETRDGPSVIPSDAKKRAKMAEAISLYGSYGYGPLLGWVGYHLFTDFIGGKNEGLRAAQYEDSKKLLALLMENADPWIIGDHTTLADYFLGPVMFYVAMAPDAEQVLSLPGVGRWWEAIQAHSTFKATEPDLG